eukprot:835861-Amphidinium_carterae.2
MLPSGHAAVALSDNLSEFHCLVPNAYEFARGRAHEQVRRTLEEQAAGSQYHATAVQDVPRSHSSTVALGD